MCRLQLTAGMQPLQVPYNMHDGLLLAAAVVEILAKSQLDRAQLIS